MKSIYFFLILMLTLGLSTTSSAQDPCTSSETLPSWDGLIYSNGDGTGYIEILAPMGLFNIALDPIESRNLTLLQPQSLQGLPIPAFHPAGEALDAGFTAWAFSSSTAPIQIRQPIKAPRVASSILALQALDGCNRIQYIGFSPLPVELVDIGILTDGPAVQLTWSTSSETNNQGFKVLYRQQGGLEEWTESGWVAGAGTVSSPRNYTYSINDLAPGSYAFRLMQVDYDGSFVYSKEVETQVTLPATFLLSAPYPNPFNPTAQVDLAVGATQQIGVALYDLTGRQVLTVYDGLLHANTQRTLSLDASFLPSGTYLLRVQGESFSATRPLTLLK